MKTIKHKVIPVPKYTQDKKIIVVQSAIVKQIPSAVRKLLSNFIFLVFPDIPMNSVPHNDK